MHPAAEAYFALTAESKKQVHLVLCQQALNIWQAYATQHGPLTYSESVVGTDQNIDETLPQDALNAIQAGSDNAAVQERYLEPLAALQDADWDMPAKIEFAYYAILNGFRLHVLKQPIEHWLVVNQALAAIGEDQALNVLQQALDTLKS